MAAITQPHAYMPLSGKRYGSFAGREEFVPTEGTGDSVVAEASAHRHVFPKHNAAIRRSGFSFSLPNLRLQVGA